MTGAKEMQVRLVARGCETVLGDAASDSELFLTSDFLTRCMINPQQGHKQCFNHGRRHKMSAFGIGHC